MSADTIDSQPPNSSQIWQPSLALAALAALAGGSAGLAVMEPLHPLFAFETMKELPIEPTAEQMQKFTATQTNFFCHNNAVYLAVVGAALGLAVGGLSVHRRRVTSAIAGGVAGCLAGAAGGYFTGFAIGQAMVISADQSLVQAALLHLAVWGPIGLGISAVVGVIQGGAATAVQGALAGLVASLLIVVGYILVASIAFPAANLIHTVPEKTSQAIVWIVTTSLCFGLALHFGLKPSKR